MPAKRGNPRWGELSEPILARDTEFELQTRKLGLTRESYVDSEELRSWCERNKDRCYIPEWLLLEWQMEGD